MTLPITKLAFDHNTVIGVLVAVSMAFIGYFWLNGLKDVLYTACYYLWLRVPHVPTLDWSNYQPRVVLAYATCNDFDGTSLFKSMQQDYSVFRTIILDDSNKPEYIQKVDEFSRRYRVPVVRRTDRTGFKAGNLNNFLMKDKWWEFFGIIDSDEVVPPDFIRRCLDYFQALPGTGIVQANHKATRNRNPFMRMFAPGVNSHWPVYQAVKAQHGFMSLLGHGAVVSRECYEAAGGFPHVVAEDICFALESKKAGYSTAFAPDVLCEEEFPVTYSAFRVRHAKWTGGNMEFIRLNTRRLLSRRSSLRWFQRLDIVLFTYSLPLTSVFSIYVIINAVVFPLAGFTLRYPLWMLLPTLMFLVAPLLNDIIWHWKEMSKRQLASYLVHSTLLFGSMYWTSLRASVAAIRGRPVFKVTPKVAEELTLGEAWRQNLSNIMFALVGGLVVIAVQGNVLPFLLLAVPALYGVYLTTLHIESTEDEVRKPWIERNGLENLRVTRT